MSISQGTKFSIHDYSQELKNKLNGNNKENVNTNKILVGRMVSNVPIKLESSEELPLNCVTPSKSTETVCRNLKTEECSKSSSFDLLLKSLLTPTIDNNPDDSSSLMMLNPSNNNSECAQDDLSFEEIMNTILTPSFATRMSQKSSQIQSAKHSCDISTQTSFDNVSYLNFSQNNCSFSNLESHRTQGDNEDNNSEFTQRRDVCNSNKISSEPVLPYFYPELDTNIESDNVTEINTLQPSVENNTTINLEPRQGCGDSLDKGESLKNILDVLSQDITIVASKIKLNCINKIGSEKWLKDALKIACKPTNKRKSFDFVEVHADFDLNTTSKPRIKRYCKGNKKIIRIENTGDVIQETSSQCSFSSFTSDKDIEESSSKQLSEVERKLCLEIDKLSKNKDLQYNDVCNKEVDKSKIKTVIHDLFVKLYDTFQNDKLPDLMLRKCGFKTCTFEDGRLQLKPYQEAPLRKINLNRLNTRLKFCRMLYIMAKAYVLLENDTILTKRELFYQIKHIVNTQRRITTALEEVSRLFNVGQWHLNIVAHSGLIYGKLKLKWLSGTVTECGGSATIIPLNIDEVVEIESVASFILVVEKESIFQKLLEEDLPNKLGHPFIMITGKGVPNFNTQRFLKKLCTTLELPVFILVDADVYGIKIMLNYRFGSIKNCHLSEFLAVPNARWLGVFPSEISKFGMQHMKLTERDKSLLRNMIKYPFLTNYPKILDELNYLMDSNRKASIEGLIKNNTFLSESYLPTKIFNQDFV